MTTSLAVGRWFVGVAAAVLLAAFIGVCLNAGTLWPWDVVVHEDGRRTLLQTVMYFEHALRELPLDLLVALAIAGAALHFFPSASPGRARRGRGLAWAVVVVTAGVLVGAFISGGGPALHENLLQMPTRQGAPLVAGAHWRYHLLDRLACMLLAFALAGLAAGSTRSGPDPESRRAPVYGVVLATYAVVTVMFGLTAEPFVDAVFLGHQARELATHTLVTVPLGLGVTLVRARVVPVSGRTILGRLRSREVLVPLGLGVVICAYLAVGVLVTGAMGRGQTSSMATLVFPHVFEHVISYVLVALAAPAVYLWRSAR